MNTTLKNTLIVVGLFLAIIVGFAGGIYGIFVGTYNSLVEMQEEVNVAESNVETMMQRRLELIPDLVSTCKKYAEHEEKIYEAINVMNQASNTLTEVLKSNDSSVEDISSANNELSSAVTNVMAIVQDNPEITASQEYIRLMDELAGSVNRITQARTDYNELVGKYNVKVRQFPGNILASIYGFQKIEEFKADEQAHQTNMVNWD